ncbi:LysR substrate-binding domain-containing protein [Novosphingobium resinovorum]|uniref:LysR substrate-binding domain-containing protein n=1 Tax=Novosphingobium TaxID=165696 RepID=UPI001B3C6772|nr:MULTISPECIES: LysR substrate-binding domain-containing protein [Novosphingobium]MBF7009946.1 LysR family transcriptional regulator [Novosphingobium sp. HR1a]WJM27968.1 LysR substrate-binding domain-containing protein [Novosphingobium resinovorum]
MPIALQPLSVFEAAARQGSFRQAADELGLTPSAVSHAVTKLENSLGTRLFDRSLRQIKLSADGEALYRHVAAGFVEIRRGLEEVSARRARFLRLHAAPSFAALWLTPRLPAFLESHPGMDIRITASTDYSRFAADEVDADIVNGPPLPGPVKAIPLGEEEVTVLCTPQMAASITCAADVMALPLINGDRNRVTWARWAELAGVPAPKAYAMRFDRSFMVIATAANGLGVALESTRLAQRELAEGRLVAPLPGCTIRETLHSLVYPLIHADRPIIRAFETWLLAELASAET